MVLENHLARSIAACVNGIDRDLNGATSTCVPPTPAVPQWHEDPVVAVEAMVRVTYRHVRMNNTLIVFENDAHNRRRTRRCASKSNELMSR
jgi:hypothetical protein